MIRRSFSYLSEKNFPLLFKALVRPHVEYAQAVWHPHKKKHITTLEKVQRRATTTVLGLRDYSYPERLRRLRMTTLAFRRHRGDMIETWKILHGKYNRAASQGILRRGTNMRTRGHKLRLEKGHCNRDTRLYSFSNRMVTTWNNLPASVVEAPTLGTFERRLDVHWKDHPVRLNFEYVTGAGENGRIGSTPRNQLR